MAGGMFEESSIGRGREDEINVMEIKEDEISGR
jgi:hypothetical protein